MSNTNYYAALGGLLGAMDLNDSSPRASSPASDRSSTIAEAFPGSRLKKKAISTISG